MPRMGDGAKRALLRAARLRAQKFQVRLKPAFITSIFGLHSLPTAWR